MRERVTIKILKAVKHHGLKKDDKLTVEVVRRGRRSTMFYEPPLRQFEIYNDEFKELPASSTDTPVVK